MNELMNKAAQILAIAPEAAEKNCKYLEEIDAYYFWNGIRGGCALILDRAGNMLPAQSAIAPEKHICEFRKRFRKNI